MRRLTLSSLVLIAFLFSCNEEKNIGPQKDSGMTHLTSTMLKSKPSTSASLSAEPSVSNYGMLPNGRMASILSTNNYTLEGLYIAEANQMYAIDNSNGYGFSINPYEPPAVAMASTWGHVYIMYTFGELYKVDPSTGSFTPLTFGIHWANVISMTALNGYLYVIERTGDSFVSGVGTLWKVDATTGSRSTLGNRNWQGAEAITALGNYVYIVSNGLLWKVDNYNGATSNLGSGEWTGIPAMAADGNYVYAIDDGLLWRINVNSGLIQTLGSGSWSTTVAMTASNGYLYAVDEGQLWKINASNGAISLLTPSGYTWSGASIRMAALQQNL